MNWIITCVLSRDVNASSVRNACTSAYLVLTHVFYSSDLQGVKTTARRDGDDWILNGSKTFITNGFMSDVVSDILK